MPFIEYCDTPYKALTGADALLLVTEWPEFTSLDYIRIKKQMNRPLIFDARNFLDKKALTQAGFEYAKDKRLRFIGLFALYPASCVLAGYSSLFVCV
jgi:hypothetical protein